MRKEFALGELPDDAGQNAEMLWTLSADAVDAVRWAAGDHIRQKRATS
jgi:hypothetical protein